MSGSHRLSEIAGLLEVLGRADTPYRAWAAQSLLRSKDAALRTQGKSTLAELSDEMQGIASLQHADLATYSAVYHAGLLDQAQRARLLAAFPAVVADPYQRARLYSSSTYVYLIARGFGDSFPQREDLVRLLDEELSRLTRCATPDIVDLVLFAAGRFELNAATPIADDILRQIRGRIHAAITTSATSTALRWFLELYSKQWPVGSEATALRQAILGHLKTFSTSNSEISNGRHSVSVMKLELMLLRDPEYQVISKADLDAKVSALLRSRRTFSVTSYWISIAAVAGLPMFLAARSDWIEPQIAWAGALGFGLPAALWATLTLFGKRTSKILLGTGFICGLVYWSGALVAGGLDHTPSLTLLGGENALIALTIETLACIAVGVAQSAK